MESAESVEAANWACLIACGYAWNKGGGSQAAELRLEVFGGGLGGKCALGLGIGFVVFDFGLIDMRRL
jgi:hypothetical protein